MMPDRIAPPSLRSLGTGIGGQICEYDFAVLLDDFIPIIGSRHRSVIDSSSAVLAAHEQRATSQRSWDNESGR